MGRTEKAPGWGRRLDLTVQEEGRILSPPPSDWFRRLPTQILTAWSCLLSRRVPKATPPRSYRSLDDQQQTCHDSSTLTSFVRGKLLLMATAHFSDKPGQERNLSHF